MKMPRQFHSTRLRLISSLAGISLLLVQAVTQAEYAVQVGAFADQERATGLVAQLRNEGFPCTMHANATGSSHLTRVRVGPYPDRATADVAYKRLDAMGIDGYIRREIQ